MKIGQLVMLIRTSDRLPPTGATGVIHDECCMSQGTRVMFSQHKDRSSADGAYCVKRTWLVPIDDNKGDIAKEDQQELDLGDGRKVSEKDLVRLAKRMLADEPA